MLRSRFIAIVTVAMLAQLALVGCAARPLESHVAAWDLVEEPAAIAEVAQSQDSESAVESPWGKPRVAVWLNPYDRSYYAETPAARAIAAAHAMPVYDDQQTQTAIVGAADGRSPVGWNHQMVVENWGVPQKVVGTSWVYYAQEGECGNRQVERRLSMENGVVARMDSRVTISKRGC